MTPYLILAALVVAAAIAAYLVVRSRREPGGRSGIDGSGVPPGGAPLAEGDDRPER